jgi:hypothetical protein
MHFGGIRMAAGAKLNDPSSIFLAIFFWPFLNEIVTEIGSGIATVTAGTGEARTKMNVLDDFLEVHVRRGLA